MQRTRLRSHGWVPGMLSCCFCLFPRINEGITITPPVQDAVTVIGGFAVCSDHLHIVCRGSVWHELITLARH